MDIDDFSKFADDPRFIPGIFNYCDRWCERCKLKERCMSYAMDKARGWEPGSTGNTSPQEVWDRLKETFEQTKSLIENLAKEHGITPPPPSRSPDEILEESGIKRESAKNHDLVTTARAYLKAADSWFKDEKGLFSEKGDELMLKENIGMGGAAEEVRELKDAVEVIRWYQPFIYVKLTRAFSGRTSEDKLSPDLPRDSDGTAKTALITVDNSITAWTSLRNHFPDKTDSILDLLIKLDQIRKGVEREFPKARSFARPGFDDQEQN